MIAVIKGDIIGSRKLNDPEKWIAPLRLLFNTYGTETTDWELVWGDFFQLEIANPEEALEKSFAIKALIKSIAPNQQQKKSSTIDVRIAIGIGDKNYTGKKISESNGPAFISAGDKFEFLKKEKLNMGIKSEEPMFDKEMNLYLKLISVFMDKWSTSSAEMVRIYLENPHATQGEFGNKLGIKQNSVSGRWARACMDHLIELNQLYKIKLSNLDPHDTIKTNISPPSR